ncbi:MAG: hypothetical protein ABWX94_00385 [Candidatus Saccharimonadales bacterium]
MNKRHQLNEAGVAHLVMIVVLVLAIVGFAGWRVYTQQHKTENNNTASNGTNSNGNAKTAEVTWSFENNTWKPSIAPPECPSPLLTSPVDLNTATAILYPGQTRGIYKPHGGVIFRNNTTNNMDVKVAIDSKLVRVSRYIQTNQVQYLLDFVSPCGVAIRYDHLHTLTQPFMDIMNKLPEPKVNDSRTTDITDGDTYAAGTLIATRIGFLAPDQNTTLDFGVYDYRKPNEASKNATYAAAHSIGQHTDYYATCWLNDLPSKDKALALALPGGDGKAGKTSDYCK